MLLQKFLETIESTNPYRIYVENVRSFFKVPKGIAKFMCEMAVVDRVFVRKIGAVCPHEDCKRIIASFDNYNEIPPVIKCDNCELLERDKFEFMKGEIETIEFYQLKKSL